MKLTEERACSLLGLLCPSNAEEARKAYRKLARTHHPDVGGDEERFKELSEAHQFLSELYEGKSTQSEPPGWAEERAQAQQKAAWDAWRSRARAARAQAERNAEGERAQRSSRASQSDSTRSTSGSSSSHERSAEGAADSRASEESAARAEVVEVEVIPSLQERVAAWGDQAAKRIAGGLSKLYRRTARAHFEAGRDKSLKLNIDLDTLFFGRQQRIRVKRLIACPSCQVGQALSDKKSASEHALGCERCLGEARVSSAEELSVMIPPGADDGHKLRVAGKGREGLKGQPSGDLYLELIPPDLPKGFKRRGAQLLLELGVPAATLRRGGLVQAQTPRGTLSIPIPPESHSGKQLKISQQGLNIWGKSAQGPKLGDLIVTLRAR